MFERRLLVELLRPKQIYRFPRENCFFTVIIVLFTTDKNDNQTEASRLLLQGHIDSKYASKNYHETGISKVYKSL